MLKRQALLLKAGCDALHEEDKTRLEVRIAASLASYTCAALEWQGRSAMDQEKTLTEYSCEI